MVTRWVGILTAVVVVGLFLVGTLAAIALTKTVSEKAPDESPRSIHRLECNHGLQPRSDHATNGCWNLMKLVCPLTKKVLHGVVVVRGEFWSYTHARAFAERCKREPDLKVVLWSSYQNFPARIDHPCENRGPTRESERFVQQYHNRVVLWCHCFRNPNHGSFTPLQQTPKLLLSESDFTDCAGLARRFPFRTDAVYDFDWVAVVGDSRWTEHIRRLEVIQSWMNAATALGMRVAVVGSTARRGFHTSVTCIPWSSQAEFFTTLTRSRYLFCASGPDASPRVLVEAGALGLPVLLNSDILGGWKYVVQSKGVVGRFFKSDDCQPQQLLEFGEQFQGSRRLVQEWYCQHVSTTGAGELLQRKIQSLHNLRK